VECIDDDFLTQMIKKPVVRCALLDLIVTKREELVGIVHIRDSTGCSDHGMLEFRIL